MWSSIANLKENLNKIVLDVHDEDDEDELEIYRSSNVGDLSSSDRRDSNSLAHSKSVRRSLVTNANDSPVNYEIEQYKSEIKRLYESEAEIKALSVNYAALLKEKEDHICRMNQENGSLKQNLSATSAALYKAQNEHSKASTNTVNASKGNGDRSPSRQHKSTNLMKNRSPTYSNGVTSKQDGISGNSNLRGKEKELTDLLEEKSKSLAAAQATFESQLKESKSESQREHEKLANVRLKLQEERKLNESCQDELKSLKADKDKTSIELSKLCNELNEKTSVVKRLQMELNRREEEDVDDIVGNLKEIIATLEKENNNLKLKKNELETALEISKNTSTNGTDNLIKHPRNLDREVEDPGGLAGKEKLELSLQILEKELKETCCERDKALHELNRLKQHLLEKESEESEKMDEDGKIIEELRQSNDYQKAQILHLEKALQQAFASKEEFKMMNNSEIKKSQQMVDDLNNKLANCMRTIDAKNVELLNLQNALRQYYAEIEAKEHLEGDLALARKQSAKLSSLLKDADERAELSKREKEEVLARLSQTERILADGKNRVNKLEEDNAKLRRAVEQSMTRLNRMSVDSDYLVDRRIVIKLLVTYFQKNHSKEVLDLMVRMLGFSDDDKQRIGVAQQGSGKRVVRGVLGLPGRLVGGILGGSSGDPQANVASDNHSFADLWVDFLLKENEERERRESEEDAASKSREESSRKTTPSGGTTSPSVLDNRPSSSSPGFSRSNLSSSSPPSKWNTRPFEPSDSEFSTVPLTSSESASRMSRLLPKY